jgi:hypothetical protein
MSKAPRPSVFGAVTTPVADVPPADTGTVATTAKPAKGETAMFKTSIYLPLSVKDKLEEIAFHEGRKKVHDLFMEGIDAVLSKRGYATTAEMKDSSKAS